MEEFSTNIQAELGQFLPSLIWAIVILILGWLAATVIAAVVRGILKRTDIDNRLAGWVVGDRTTENKPPIEQWTATAVFWIIMIFVIVAFLNALRLEAVSEPLNDFLQQIFAYLPRLGGAAILLGIAWIVATVSKFILTRGLQQFRLDEQLAQRTGAADGTGSPFLLSETLANALYWFVFLFFLPLILDALQLTGPLGPVQNLLDQILSALPKILTAIIIGAVGWLIARVVRGIVTNLLAATGVDHLGRRFGLSRPAGGLSLSSLIGTIVYVLVLIPTAIAALNALEIQAISAPAISMLEQILDAIPLIFTAALVLVVFYVIGRFVADIVTNILRSVGFDNVFNWLGLPTPDFTTPTVTTPPPPPPPSSMSSEMAPPPPPPLPEQRTLLQTTGTRTPSEIVGIIVLVGIVLFGAVAASEVLQFEVLTSIVQAILRISARILSGVIVFAIGLYLANLAYNLITSSGSRQARILGQAARISIIALVGAMGLQQMGVATDIVNLAFGLLLGAVAVAIALAFGLGGRDVAGEQLREWLSSFKRNY